MKIVELLKNIRFVEYPFYWHYKKDFTFKIVTPQETVDLLKTNKKSLARFGDGEMNIMFNQRGIGFQKYDADLADELLSLVDNKLENLFLALPHGFVSTSLYKASIKFFWWNYVSKNHKRISTGFNEVPVYLDTNFSRTVTELKNKTDIQKHVMATKGLWKHRNVLVIEGKDTKFGVNNDLLEESRSVKRIVGPQKDAYTKIDEMEMAAVEYGKRSDDLLVLLALGPTATVLSARLARAGLQAIDIGHFDLQYEYFIRNSFKRIPIPTKFNNELANSMPVEKVYNQDYEKQILMRIK
ncbi:GT-D fold domain-containing glycosyltransferase [Furfurilactobacillus siliginis]|uniref:GT-D fold domain-containing glycosyltransferase n=1 Tax=Furfurilactobacillus siliginis TaxID=348151 RepID=UPI00138F40D9|nr:GT-D fold domain-containing glycosyltransferase [Furfurilactobacillus siliginis]